MVGNIKGSDTTGDDGRSTQLLQRDSLPICTGDGDGMSRQIVADRGRYGSRRLLSGLTVGNHGQKHRPANEQNHSNAYDNAQGAEETSNTETCRGTVIVGMAAHPQGIFIFILTGIGRNILAGVVIAVVQLFVIIGALDVHQPAGVAIAVYVVFFVVNVLIFIAGSIFRRIDLPCVRANLSAVFDHGRIDRAKRGVRVIIISGKKGRAVAGGAYRTPGRSQTPRGRFPAQTALLFFTGQFPFFQADHFVGKRIPRIVRFFVLPVVVHPDIGLGLFFILHFQLPRQNAACAVGFIRQFRAAVGAVGQPGPVPFAAFGTFHRLAVPPYP